MNNTSKLKFLQKKSFLQNNIVSYISNCLKVATEKEQSSSIKSQLTSSIKSALKKAESSKSLVNKANFNTDSNLILDTINYNTILISNPRIEKLIKNKRIVKQELWLKENELRDLHHRYAITKDLTRNAAIKGLVFNIIEKFKTLSKEKQIKFATDKRRLSRIVENYVENLIDFYEEEKSWGVDFTDKEKLLDDLSTVKDITVLAANLSSKYVKMATRTAHGAARLQLEICIKERDELKLKLIEIDKQLDIEYGNERGKNGVNSEFGGGSSGSAGSGTSFGNW